MVTLGKWPFREKETKTESRKEHEEHVDIDNGVNKKMRYLYKDKWSEQKRKRETNRKREKII